MYGGFNMKSSVESLEFYQKLFTLVKVKGKEPLIEFFKSLEEIKEQKIDTIITQLLFRKGPIGDVFEKNRFIVSFLMSSDFLILESMIEKKKIILNLLNLLTPEKLTKSFNNLEILENLGITKVCLSSSPRYYATFDTTVYVYADGKSIKKTYSDVDITYSEPLTMYCKDEVNEMYRPHYGSDFGTYPSWVIVTDNKWEQPADRIIYLSNFSFSSSKLPSLEELNSYYKDQKENQMSLILHPLSMVSNL